MEIKKVLEDLEIVNDINNLPLKELEKKYLRDEQTYNKFSREFYSLFASDNLYQLRVAKQYEKIANLFNIGANTYLSGENDEIHLSMLDIMAYNTGRYRLRDSDRTGSYQAQAGFFSKFGGQPTGVTYEELLLEIEEGAKKYLATKTSAKDFLDRVPKRIYDLAISPEGVKAIIDDYAFTKDGISLCNDMDFLSFANYMISFYPNTVDENFKKEVASVIRASSFLQHFGYYDRNNFDKDNYNRLARRVTRKINRDRRKEDRKEKREMSKAKTKQFFTKILNQ